MQTAPMTLKSLYTNALRKYRERVAVYCADQSLTYGDLLEQSGRAAHALIDLGVAPNTRIALLMSNCVEYLVGDQAIIQSGAAKVPLNDMLGEREIVHILADSNARVAIVGPAFFEIVARNREQLPELAHVVGVAAAAACPEGFIGWEAFLAGGEASLPDVVCVPDDLALIAYTGGTTGLPKGAMHTQQAMALDAFSHVVEIELGSDERVLLCSPLPHSAGFVMLAGLLKGAVHFVEQRFDPKTVIRRIEHDRITLTFMVPTMIYRLLDCAFEASHDLSSLRTLVYGAAPITEHRLRQGLALLGPVFMQLYGQTEAPNFVTRLSREDHLVEDDAAARLRSCGQPTAMARVRIVDDNGGDVPAGDSGELAALTPYNMVGYHGQPEKTAETLVDGWLRTGDIARQDGHGYVYLLDRQKDMIITGGMNVYTTEVESAVQPCAGVSQVAVVGLPDSDWGEAVTAFVVPESHGAVSEAQIIEHARGELSRYKVPKRVLFIEALPVTAYGKPDKKALRAQGDA